MVVGIPGLPFWANEIAPTSSPFGHPANGGSRGQGIPNVETI